MSALTREHAEHGQVHLDDDPRFPYTGCAAYVVVFGHRQWCQQGICHVGLHH